MKNLKRGMSILLSVLMVITLTPSMVFAGGGTAGANNSYSIIIANDGSTGVTEAGIKALKTIERNGYSNNQFKITLKVEADGTTSSIETSTPSHVVLVIDRSASMKDNNRLAQATSAAALFADGFLGENSAKENKLAVVSFAKKANTNSNPNIELSNNCNKIKAAIKNITADGGTNIQTGIKNAQEILKQGHVEGVRDIIVLLSDGEPTYSYRLNAKGNITENELEKIYTITSSVGCNYTSLLGDGSNFYGYENKNILNNISFSYTEDRLGSLAFNLSQNLQYNGISVKKDVEKFSNHGVATKWEADQAKASGTEIYSIGVEIGTNTDAKSVMKGIASDDEHYKLVNNVSDLANTLKGIQEEISVSYPELYNVTDVIPEYITLGNITSEEALSYKNRTLTWDLTKATPIETNNKRVYTVTYPITVEQGQKLYEVINSSGNGTAPTNGLTVLNYGEKTLGFNIPTIKCAAKTVKFDANEGAYADGTTVAAITTSPGVSINTSAYQPTRQASALETYKLKGWATAKTAINAELTTNQSIAVTSDITYYAVWEAVPKTELDVTYYVYKVKTFDSDLTEHLGHETSKYTTDGSVWKGTVTTTSDKFDFKTKNDLSAVCDLPTAAINDSMTFSKESEELIRYYNAEKDNTYADISAGYKVVPFRLVNCKDGVHVDCMIVKDSNYQIGYTINYYYGQNAVTPGAVVTGAAIEGTTVSAVTAQYPVATTYKNIHYVMDAEDQGKTLTISRKDDNILNIRYLEDELKDADNTSNPDDKDSLTGGDGVADMYQSVINYKAEPAVLGNVEHSLDVVTFKTGNNYVTSGAITITNNAWPIENADSHFINWTSGITGFVSTTAPALSATCNLVAKSSYTVTANFGMNTHTLSYKFEGDIPDGMSAPESVSLTKGAVTSTAIVTIPPATSSGSYTFSGWYMPDGSTPVTSVTMGSKDIELTGTWGFTYTKYNVTFDANGHGKFEGELTVETIVDLNYNSTISAISLTEEADDEYVYTLIGWNRNKDATAAAITTNGVITVSDKVDENTYYAIYSKTAKTADYKVNYLFQTIEAAKAGTHDAGSYATRLGIDSKTITGTAIGTTTAAVGLDTAPTGFTLQLPIVQKIVNKNGLTEVNVYYNRNSYNVIYTVDSTTTTASIYYEDEVTPLEITDVKAVADKGYNLPSQWETATGIEWASGPFSMPANEVTFTSSSTYIQYVVTFDAKEHGTFGDGTNITTFGAIYNSTLPAIGVPNIATSAAVVYNLLGWNTDENATEAAVKVGEELIVEGNQTYYAVYDEITNMLPYTIKYHYIKADGSGVSVDMTPTGAAAKIGEKVYTNPLELTPTYKGSKYILYTDGLDKSFAEDDSEHKNPIYKSSITISEGEDNEIIVYYDLDDWADADAPEVEGVTKPTVDSITGGDGTPDAYQARIHYQTGNASYGTVTLNDEIVTNEGIEPDAKEKAALMMLESQTLDDEILENEGLEIHSWTAKIQGSTANTSATRAYVISWTGADAATDSAISIVTGNTNTTSLAFTGRTLDGIPNNLYVTGNQIYTFTANFGYSGGGGGGGGGGTTIKEPEVPLVNLEDLNMDDHFQYIQGYEDGTVRPEGNITREEVAAIFYRLLTDDARILYSTGSEKQHFNDVADNRWSVKAIKTLANANVLVGYNDGTFRPGAYITRAEFATVTAKFNMLKDDGSVVFSDVADNYWAKDYIYSATTNGWISGYEDGTFRPFNYIKRDESANIINKVLGRRVDAAGLGKLDINQFSDLENTSAWYYYQMVEATNYHDYDRKIYDRTDSSMNETWTELYPNKDYSED